LHGLEAALRFAFVVVEREAEVLGALAILPELDLARAEEAGGERVLDRVPDAGGLGAAGREIACVGRVDGLAKDAARGLGERGLRRDRGRVGTG
jgi:hypothetical protein